MTTDTVDMRVRAIANGYFDMDTDVDKLRELADFDYSDFVHTQSAREAYDRAFWYAVGSFDVDKRDDSCALARRFATHRQICQALFDAQRISSYGPLLDALMTYRELVAIA